MDPLSLAVSIIAITGAIKTTAKGIASLRKIRNGPKELASLLNETDELYDILCQIQSALDQIRSGAPHQEDAYRFRAMKFTKEQVQKADDAMVRLDRLGQICSKKSDSGQIECSRRKWQQNRTQAMTLLSDVQSIQAKLLSSLIIINLSSTIRLETSNREVVFSQNEATQILSTLVRQMAAQTSPIRRALSTAQDVTEVYQPEGRGSEALSTVQHSDARMDAGKVEVGQVETLPARTTEVSRDFQFAQGSQAFYEGKKCSLWCSCACHSPMTFSVLSRFGAVSGSLSSLPWRKRCTEYTCKGPNYASGSIVYQFPSWFWGRLIALTMNSSPICGPEINVRFHRAVMPSKLYLSAFHGDTDRVKSLFTEGAASPWDVNDNGSSGLYFAAISGDVELCKFMVAQGADPLFENQYHMSPVSIAWERILSDEVNPDKAADLVASLGRTDYINTLQFKPLHKAVLGLVPLPLRPLLDCSSSDVNVQDREGRTGLSWATTKDDVDSSSLLLGHGADVNKSDNRGFSPIHYTKSLPSLKLLLEHNADITLKTEVGATPLHFASRYGRHDMIETMVEAGADPNASEADDTPLICSTYDHKPKSTEMLLSLGADPDLVSKRSGLTALHFAVTDNQHGIIQQLLSYDANYTFEADNEQTILHVAAIHGDKVTMDILRGAKLMGLEPDARDALGKTAREYFEERCEKQNCRDDVRTAFTRLMDSISANRRPQEDDDSIHEVFHDAIEQF